MNSSTARHLSIASIGFAVDSGSAGSSIITVGRRDETRWSIPCLGSLVGHYGSEQRYRRLDFGGSGVRRDSDGNRHESAIQRDVEQFLTITAPTYLTAAVRGNGPLVSGAGERLDVSLNAARLIRLVRDPLAVRRELPVLFFARTNQIARRGPAAVVQHAVRDFGLPTGL
jgi:hypothetical protein